jgi:uncharacterized membrane protein YphA (DoxX/SURF4 family)
MKKTTIIESIIFLYAILFLYTGISKVADYSTFKEQLRESPIIGPIAPFVACMVPLAEFLIVVMLAVPRWRFKGLLGALILMTSFTLYIIIIMAVSDKLPCSCGGIIAELSWAQHIVFNCAFILLALWGISMQKKYIKDKQRQWMPITHKEPTGFSKSI